MIRKITLKGVEIEYDLKYKNVKNVNLRIKADGTVHVSASQWVTINFIENFLISKADFILDAISEFSGRPNVTNEWQTRYFTDIELKKFIIDFCREIYPYYFERRVSFPDIKFRKMVSRWGSCHPGKLLLTFNTALAYAPPECVKYIVYHEFTHFIEPNHGKYFYYELEKVCPNHRELSERMKEIDVRGIYYG